MTLILPQMGFWSAGGYAMPNGTILNSFDSPWSEPRGLTFDGTNLISCDRDSFTIYVHDGVSSTVLNSFAAPTGISFGSPSPRGYPTGLAFDGANLISCDNRLSRIFVHDGVSSTVLNSFASPTNYPTGLTFDGTNLISCDDVDTIYVHDGVSSTILNSFAAPNSFPSGLTFGGTNLISCNALGTIYVHDGVSSTILNSFASPSSGPTGLAFEGTNLISCDRDSDTIYIHDKG